MSGNYLLHDAVKTNNFDLVQKLILFGNWDINDFSNYDGTPLHIAVKNRHTIKIIKYLLENGAKINVRDHYSRSPLFIAAFYENFNVIEILLD